MERINCTNKNRPSDDCDNHQISLVANQKYFEQKLCLWVTDLAECWNFIVLWNHLGNRSRSAGWGAHHLALWCQPHTSSSWIISVMPPTYPAGLRLTFLSLLNSKMGLIRPHFPPSAIQFNKYFLNTCSVPRIVLGDTDSTLIRHCSCDAGIPPAKCMSEAKMMSRVLM